MDNKVYKTREDILKYLAGFFDGDGNILIYKPKTTDWVVEAKITQIQTPALKEFRKLFGGGIYWISTKTTIYNGFYQWRVVSKKAYIFLKEIEPYLIQKREEAKIAIAFREVKIPDKDSMEEMRVNLKKKFLETRNNKDLSY